MKTSLIIISHKSKNKALALIKTISLFEDRPEQVILINDGIHEFIDTNECPINTEVYNLDGHYGAGYARNYGAQKAKNDIFIFLDSDVVPSSNYLSIIKSELGVENNDTDVVGGLYLEPKSTTSKIEKLNHFLEFGFWNSYQNREIVPSVYGGLCAFKKEAWFSSDRSYKENFFFPKMASGEDTLIGYEVGKKYKIRIRLDLTGEHYSDISKRLISRSKNQAYSRLILILTKNVPKIIDKSLNEQSVPTLFLFYFFLVLSSISLYFLVVAVFFLLFSYKRFFRHFNIQYYPSIIKYLFMEQTGWVLGVVKAFNFLIISYIQNKLRLFHSMLSFLFFAKYNRLFFFVTNRCNFTCSWCLDGNRPEENKGATFSKELSVNEVELFTKNSKVKIPYLVITGGEPFLRDDLHLIIEKFYNNSQTTFVTINSNGSFPQKTYDILEKIFLRCPSININIQLTVSGTPDNHDTTREFKNSYSLLVETAKKIHSLKSNCHQLIFSITTQVFAKDFGSIKEIIDTVKSDFKPNEHIVTFIRDTSKLITPDFVEASHIEEVVNYLFKTYNQKNNFLNRNYQFLLLNSSLEINKTRMGLSKYIPCRAGKKYLTLYENGNVLACENRIDLLTGNIRDFNYNLLDKQLQNLIKEKYEKQILEKCKCDWGCSVTDNITQDYSILFKSFLKSVLPKKNY